MKKKLLVVIGCFVAVLLLGAAAVESVNQLYIEPRTVSSWSELVDGYLSSRMSLPPLPFAYEDALTRMEVGDWSFLADYWQCKQTDGSYYVAKSSRLRQGSGAAGQLSKLKLPLHVRVYEDLQRGEIFILSSTDGEKYQGEALFKAPEFMPYEKDFPLDVYLLDELAPRRVVWEITLKSEADAWSDLLKVEEASSLSESQAGVPAPQMMMMSVPAEQTTNIWLCLEPQTGSEINLNVFAPEGFTNRVEVYSCPDLVSNVWEIAVQNLYPGTNPAVWDASSALTNQFFRAGNMDVDSDSDGINDAREGIVHKTAANLWDTDGDWMPDGWELMNSLNALTGNGAADADGDGLSNSEEYQRGTGPFDADSDDDGLSDGDEAAAGTDPLQADTDGDGLPDGWEVRFGYDPVNKAAGALSGADQIGQFNTDGSALAVEVRGDIAYVADGANGLVMVDVHHPGGIELSSLALGGEANDLLLTNDTLWVALGEYGVAAVDVSDPFRPQLLGSFYTGGYSRGLALQSNLLYVANTSSDLLILNVEHLDDIVQVGQYDYYFSGAVDVCVSGTNAWVSFGDRIYQLNVSDPSSPVVFASMGATTHDMQLRSNHLYLASGGGLQIWNSDCASYEYIGEFDTEGTACKFSMESNRILVAEGLNYAELIDVSTETNPALITGITVNGFANDAALHGERGYLAAGEEGLSVVRFYATDADADGMDDNWEILHFGSISASATNDFDGDGIFNREEFMIGTSPAGTDSDADGLSDSDEIHIYVSDPTRADGDLDGLPDYAEINTYNTDAGSTDTDGDGMPDGWEVLNGFDPLVADGTGDADSDGLCNAAEYQNRTNPQAGDSDGDGLSDGWEVLHGTSNTSTNQPLQASFEQVAVRDTDGEAYGLFAKDGYLYVADGTNGLVVFDLSIPSAPSLVATLDTAGFAYDVTVSNQYAYVADGSNGLVIVAVSNPVSPVAVGHYDTAGTAKGIAVQSNWVYLADGIVGNAGKVEVFDVSNPAAPIPGTPFLSMSSKYDVFMRGNSAYVAAFQNVIRLDISDPAVPQATSASGFIGKNVIRIHGNDSIVAAVLGSTGVKILNDTSISNHTVLGSYDTAGTASGVFVAGNTAYVADGSAGILLLDISTPTNPVMKYQRDTAGNALDVFPDGEYVYAADGTNGLAVFRFVEDTDQDGMSDFWESAYFGNLTQSATNDFDGDGLSNWAEYLIAGNPSTNDADGDLLSDYAEIWMYHTQPLNSDTDFDGRDDRAELLGLGGVAATDPLNSDCDNDGLLDGAEITAGSDPHDADTDGDGMPDGWEIANGLSPVVANASSDHDSDGLSNLAEYQHGSKADTADSDNDGLEDGAEITAGTGILTVDSDSDGLTDGAEVNTHNTNPLNTNSDADSMPDGWEVTNGLNPLSDDASADHDYDGLTNAQEYQYGTKANDYDSDNDGYSDGYEITHGLNPVSNDTDGDGIHDDDDEIPSGFKVIIPGAVTNVIDYWTGSTYNSQTPLYIETYHFVPSNLPPTNITINITNVVMRGYVWDAFKINGVPYAWAPAAKNYTNNITTNVAATLGGTNIAGFSIDLYKWNSGSFYSACCLYADIFIQFQKSMPVEVSLTPDHDRNGTINSNDLARAGQTFRFWVNDDNDSGYDGGDDIPGVSSPDYSSSQVDGVRDLIDLFPVKIAISNSAPEYINSTNGYHWYLCHDGNALNVLQTTLTATNTGNYLRNVTAASGLANATTHWLTQSGWELPTNFVQTICNGGGIILVEARAPTTKPLRLELRKVKPGGGEDLIGECELPLSITGVEQMFRHKNLRDDLGGEGAAADRLNSPTNWPDSLCNGKYVVMLHGFNVTGQEARGWNSETFKRLWWAGSRAKFVGVSWYGDQSNGFISGKVSYHHNVQNAFKTAPLLKDYLSTLSGEKIAIGHSLGNMVVSAAIEDYSAPVSKYFMVNAAVASEAYDPNSYDSVNMVHPDWDDYTNRLWCSEWYKLFEGMPDFRTNLTWRGRFSSVVPVAYNFYSPGEEVLAVQDDEPSLVTWSMLRHWDFSRYAWWKQELLKGRNHLLPVAGSLYGGWGFNDSRYPYPLRLIYQGDGHTQLSDEQLRTEPLFDDGGCDALYHNSGSSYAQEYYNQLLAEMIPATSDPAGRMMLEPLEQAIPPRNFNMQADLKNDGAWPRSGGLWEHSDFRKVAYPYVYKLYDKFKTLEESGQ